MKTVKRLFSALLVVALLVPMMSFMTSAANFENKYDSTQKVIGIPPTERDAVHTSTNQNYYASNLIELQPGDVVTFAPVATNLAYHARTYTPDGAKKDDKVKTSDCEIVEDIVPGISILRYTVPEDTGSMRFAINQMFGDSFLVTVNQEFSKEDYLTYMELAGINVSYFRPTAAEGELVNVFPKADTTFAGYVDKTGAEKEKADYRTSALIPVNEGDIIYFAGCALDQTYQLVTYDASGAPAEEATTLNYVSRYVDLGDGYGICAYKARPGTAGVRIVAPAATYEAGKVLVTVNQPITLDAYNAFLSTIPETEPIPETTAVPETTAAPAPETTEAPAVTEEPTEAVEQTEAPAPEQTTAPATAEKGCGGMISGAVAVIAILGTAIVFKRKEN
jgi:hypothetical protein